MNPKAKKALIIFGPLVIGVGVILWINRKPKDKDQVGAAGADGVAPVTLANTANKTSSFFPLKQGSKNSKVTELQKLLGVSADGIFGPITETALVALSGSKTVANQNEFDNVKKLATGISNSVRASDLLAKFKSANYSIMPLAAATYPAVIQDTYGALQATGTAIKVVANKVLNNTDYVLTGVTKAGNLLMQITNGSLAGLYSVDPTTITLTN